MLNKKSKNDVPNIRTIIRQFKDSFKSHISSKENEEIPLTIDDLRRKYLPKDGIPLTIDDIERELLQAEKDGIPLTIDNLIDKYIK